MKLEDAARSELVADPGIMSPLLDGSHLSSTFGKNSFQIWVHLNEKFCWLTSSFTSGTSSLSLSVRGRNLMIVTGDSILAYVKSLPRDKAVFDEIPLFIMRQATPCFIEPLTHIVNLSLKSGLIPSICKKASAPPCIEKRVESGLYVPFYPQSRNTNLLNEITSGPAGCFHLISIHLGFVWSKSFTELPSSHTVDHLLLGKQIYDNRVHVCNFWI